MKGSETRRASRRELETLLLQMEGQLQRIDASLQGLRSERAELANRMNMTRQSLAAACKRESAGPNKPRVSAHALLRYLERNKGLDVRAIEDEILTPSAMAAIQAGASGIKQGGCEFVIKDGVIVTVLE